MASGSFPRRLCGLCRLPGHNRTKCNITDLNDSSHVDDGPAGDSIVNGIRRRRAQRIRENGFIPMTKEEYCLTVYGMTWQDMCESRRQKAPIPLPNLRATRLQKQRKKRLVIVGEIKQPVYTLNNTAGQNEEFWAHLRRIQQNQNA